ncbi:MAG: nucleotide exchange factor GrpE [Patescibacteria group bacterium]
MPDDDIVLEAEDGEGNTATPSEKLKKTRDERDEARKQRDEYLAGWQRAKADYVNLERRLRTLGQELSKTAATNMARSVIAAFDSLESALKTASADAPKVAEGIAAVVRQLEEGLKEHAVTRFSPSVGEQFDPVRHEAVQTLATEKKEDDNTVTECLQSGYELDGTVVRPARVVVRHYQGS